MRVLQGLPLATVLAQASPVRRLRAPWPLSAAPFPCVRRSLGALVPGTARTPSPGRAGIEADAAAGLGREKGGTGPTVLTAAASAAAAASTMASGSGLVPGHGADTCIFCKIRDGTIPSTKVLETEHALAVLDAFPMAKGHTLLIPKKHYAFMEEMPAEEAAALLKELPRLAKAVRQATGAEGINIAQNNGSVAGQVVFHVHIHLLPRAEGDGLFKMGKSGGMISPEEAAAIQVSITSAL